jgi:hypothetical protein
LRAGVASSQQVTQEKVENQEKVVGGGDGGGAPRCITVFLVVCRFHPVRPP